MARQKRIVERKPIISRTVERIAIASLAAIATRGSSESIALVAITIFVILVSIEELGRSWIWDAQWLGDQLEVSDFGGLTISSVVNESGVALGLEVEHVVRLLVRLTSRGARFCSDGVIITFRDK
jgi:hypothetical protein